MGFQVDVIATVENMVECRVGGLCKGFTDYLYRIEHFAQKLEGRIISRQIIAKAIVDWELITGVPVTG
ncbi:hypothetical protein LCGC14_1590790 [marine sediment metagenome]|uniref:Uncharacterized protein n=1 Tax=marine sediment metagenome TaxID=412755 RepID=A0A0F9IEE0_9ZZZZ